MIIPTSSSVALLLAILPALCWGLWPGAARKTGRWRFELFYYDFAIGVLLTSALAAVTLGSLGSDITLLDNLSIIRRLQMGYALVAGGVFNLGNMLLLGAISIAGTSVAYPIGFSSALLVGVGWASYERATGNSTMLLGGGAAAILAIIVAVVAYDRLRRIKAAEFPPASGSKSPPRRTSAKAVVISLIGGAIMGTLFPLLELARHGGEIEMGPYPIALLFGVGVLATTLPYNLYFINLPVQGKAISMLEYFRGSKKNHLLGIGGGALWAAGMIATLVAAAAPMEARPDSTTTFALAHAAGVVGTLFGLLYWKEFPAPGKLQGMMWAAAGCLTLSLVLVGASGHAGRDRSDAVSLRLNPAGQVWRNPR
jgi:glucose uptake protein